MTATEITAALAAAGVHLDPWDETFRAMWQLIDAATEQPAVRRVVRPGGRVNVPTPAAGVPAVLRLPPG